MKYTITTIPHHKQRYDTVGDWKFNKNGIDIKVSKSYIDYEFLVMIHELVEAYLCLKNGIDENDVTQFDIYFKGKGEPGDDPEAPYYNEHLFATYIEEILADELGVDWNEYDKTLYSLPYPAKGYTKKAINKVKTGKGSGKTKVNKP